MPVVRLRPICPLSPGSTVRAITREPPVDIAENPLPDLVEGLELVAPDAALFQAAKPALDEGVRLAFVYKSSTKDTPDRPELGGLRRTEIRRNRGLVRAQ
jgi:hypothetical protein